nr:immunoglobulin heavy chain junction region [Macaca mulatta]MOX58731.1 immunoglobulin heavy chain junction region [Macaca mulatta]MOX58781.1 immunoglobulin heavy chain junction region [Macaca mulatta]MOX58791.1 immunoglobulin heavy chain junction region [Macaca mulatta]MOX58976.1 immunoglobulin heavy chain junction region [Macaca mulatta]
CARDSYGRGFDSW